MKIVRYVLVCIFTLLAVFVFSACDNQPAQPSVEPTVASTPTPTKTATATPAETATPTPAEPTIDPALISPTTGLQYSGKYQPVAVMVNNNEDCWPQTGLQAADVVYEVTVEGQITRFMAIYNDTLPDEVGSVRSARVSACDLWQEWQSIFVHWGGEGDMNGNEHVKLNSFDTTGMQIRVDGMYDTTYMFRTKEGHAPNNSRVNVAKVVELYAKKNYTPPVHTFAFDPKADLSSWQSMSSVTIPYGYPTRYDWDAASGSFLRSCKGKPSMDKATGKQLSFKNLVLMFMPHRTLKDNEHHVVINNVGTGKAMFFRDGKYIEGTWEKATKQSPAIYKDKAGNLITFTPGNTYIGIAKTDFDVVVK